jgi:hypothetical protein
MGMLLTENGLRPLYTDPKHDKGANREYIIALEG